MTVEMTRFEAELLIAMLVFADGAAPILQPELVEAMRELQPWRSALMMAYLRSAPRDAPGMQTPSETANVGQSKASGDAE